MAQPYCQQNMTVNENLILAFLMMTIGQILLCISQLLARARARPLYWMLIAFFSMCGIGALLKASQQIWPTLPSHLSLAAVLPVCLLLAPFFSLYLQGLTHPSPWHFHHRHAGHFIVPLLGVGVGAMVLVMGGERVEAVFGASQDPHSTFELVTLVATFGCFMLWVVQTSVYMVLGLRRLAHYRGELKQLFSSNDHRELRWISALIVMVCGMWLVTIAALFAELVGWHTQWLELFKPLGFLLMIWFLAHWGLRQKPGYEECYTAASLANSLAPNAMAKKSTVGTNDPSDNAAKYRRSALTVRDMQRIAQKLETIMQEQQLFLQADLSLQRLADAIGVSTHYLSQTLNEQLGKNFFDYVNYLRIEYAKPLITANLQTVLDIALEAGFNARSSFYKVFKREVGMTPSDYRKQFLL